MNNFKDNINKITSTQISNWKERVKYHKDNPWLKEYSYKIAQTALYVIENSSDLNQIKLANLLEVSPQRINTILKGKENLTLQVIYNLSKALNVELISFPEYEDIVFPKKVISYHLSIDSKTEAITEEVMKKISTILNEEGIVSIGSLLTKEVKTDETKPIISTSKMNIA